MNWAVIGCAAIAQRSVIPAILSIENNRLVAVASRTKAIADDFALQFHCEGIEGYENLLEREDVDAVYIPLPTGLHHEWVVKALKRGKHVLVEKSAFATLNEAEHAVGLAKEKGLVMIENFQFQHHAQNKYVKQLLDRKDIGEIRCFRSSFGFPPFDSETNIRYKPELGGGSLLDSGAYVLKATTFLLGNDFKVDAAHLYEHRDYKVDWFGGAFLTSKEENIFSEVAFGFDNYYQCNYEIWGSTGKISATRAFTAKPDFAASIIVEKNGKAEEVVLERDDHFRNMILHFNKVVSEKNGQYELDQILIQARLIDQVKMLSAKSE